MNLRTVVICCVLLCGFATSASSTPSVKTESMGDFYKANAAYKSNDYEGALKLYGKIIESGYSSPAVYYNLGNCFIKVGRVGRALLWYERALRITARDADLQANWSFAKGMIKIPEPAGKSSLARRVFVHLPFVTEDEIVLILCLLAAAISAMVLLGLYLRWRFRKTLAALIVLGALFVFHVFALIVKVDESTDQAVILETVEVKYEPEKESTTHFTAYEGWKVRFLRESGGWVKVERPDGLQGWLPREDLELI